MKNFIIYFSFIFFLNISFTHSMMGSLDDDEYVLRAKVIASKESIQEVETNIFTGCSYKISLKQDNRVLDNTGMFSQPLRPLQDGSNNQVWTLISDPEFKGYIVKIMRTGERRVLDNGKDSFIDIFDLFNRGGVTSWDLHSSTHKHYDRQIWSLRATNIADYFTLSTARMKDHVLTFNSEQNQLCFAENKETDNQLWKFIPTNYQISATIENFNYEPNSQEVNFSKKESSYVAFKAINKGSINDIHHVSITKTVTNSSSWSFIKSDERSFLLQGVAKLTVQPIKVEGPPTEQSTNTSSSVGAVASIPSWACNIGGELGGTITWGKKTTSSETTQKLEQSAITFNLTSDITVPPSKEVVYKLIWKEIEVSIPFTADVKLTGSVQRLKKDGTIGFSEMNADDLFNLLQDVKCTGQVFLSPETFVKSKDNISGKIKGKVHVKDAQDGEVVKEEFELSSSNAPSNSAKRYEARI